MESNRELQALVLRVQRGGAGERFERDWYRLYRASENILRPFLGKTRQVTSSGFEDFFQDFLGDLFADKLAKYDPGKGTYSTWLKRVSLNFWTDRYRKGKKERGEKKDKKEAEPKKWPTVLDKSKKSNDPDKGKARPPEPVKPQERERERDRKAALDEIEALLLKFPVEQRLLFLLLYPVRPLAGTEEFKGFARLFRMSYKRAMEQGLLKDLAPNRLSRMSGGDLLPNTITVRVRRVAEKIRGEMLERGINPADLFG